MKAAGDALYCVYENDGSFGQRMLGCFTINSRNRSLSYNGDFGKMPDGYWQTYMPYPFMSPAGELTVAGMDDGRVYKPGHGLSLYPGQRYLIGTGSSTSYPLSMYVSDIFQLTVDDYIYVGRQPKGGIQAALRTDCATMEITEIKPLIADQRYPSWIVNTGEMIYNSREKICAYAYRLFPKIDFFDLDGNTINSVIFAIDSFDPSTIDMADTETLNPIHFIDLTQTASHIYALYCGTTIADAMSENAGSTIYRLDSDGKVAGTYSVGIFIRNFAAINDTTFIAWTGSQFLFIKI